VSRHAWLRPLGHAAGVLAVVVVGAGLGAAMTPSVSATVGPLSLDVRVVPSVRPGVHLLVPPAGEVTFATHLAPVAVNAAISEVDLEKARALINSPEQLRGLQTTAPDDLRSATVEAAALAAACTLAGALGLGLLVYRSHWRRTAQVAATVTGALVLTGVVAGVTFDSDRFAQPRFEGLLSQAPYVANQTSSLVKRLESYRTGLAAIVESVTTLYGKSGDLPVIPQARPDDLITVLHISDIHLNPLGYDLTARLVKQFGVNLVIDTGDITTWGTEVESATLSRIRQVGVPYVFVRGNHDSARTQRAVAANPNAVVLDGGVAEVGGLVIAGLGDPRFTPDASVTVPSPGTPPSSGAPPSAAASEAPPTATSPRPSTAAQAVVQGEDPELIEGRRLARLIRSWDAAHPDRPVDIAAFHEPAGTPPLDGLVPLALAGHLHHRVVKTYPQGTRLMVEGSTGGAGFDSLKPSEGQPVPLSATVLYLARSGARAGQLLAYDEVTVGGFGLASVSLERTVLRPDAAQLTPGQLRGPLACPDPTSPAAAGSPASAAPAERSAGSPALMPFPVAGGSAPPVAGGSAAAPSPGASPTGAGASSAGASSAGAGSRSSPSSCPSSSP
jgi:predicted MPP superfamily phosphohydrolase